jgi:hypothetical protein
MYTRLIYLVSLVLVLSLVGYVQAQDATWTDATGDHNWFTPGNWSDFPTDAHWAKIRNGDPGPTIASGSALASRVHIGYSEGGALTMDGGTLDISGDDLMIGKQGGAGILNMNGGTITIRRDLEVSGDATPGPGFIYMTGGTIIVGDDFEIPETETHPEAIAEVHLDDGTIILDDSYEGDSHLRMYPRGSLDIRHGTLILAGDEVSRVQGYIDNGWITAYDANGTVALDYDVTNPGQTTVKAIHKLNPNPADGGVAVPGTVTLEWTVDAGTPVDVVFGNSPDWTTWEKLVDKQAVTSISVTVVAEQRYYWAVDTYAPGAEVPDYGPIFSFLAGNAPPVVNAGDDVPAWLDNGSVDVALAGTVTDTDPTTTVWTVVSEPDDPNSPDAVIADAAALSTSITLSALGEYVLQLQADDGEYTGSDTMTINVYSDNCEAAKSLPDYVPLVGDVNEDCIVDARDFALIAVNWLESNAL